MSAEYCTGRIDTILFAICLLLFAIRSPVRYQFTIILMLALSSHNFDIKCQADLNDSMLQPKDG